MGDDYEPYSSEWEKEMMKLSKKELISMIKRIKSSDKVLVSRKPLKDMLLAVSGPSHYIRELQATRNLPIGKKNPIDTLIDEYNQDS